MTYCNLEQTDCLKIMNFSLKSTGLAKVNTFRNFSLRKNTYSPLSKGAKGYVVSEKSFFVD